MTAVLVTGMSGTGKSSVLAELGSRGFRVVDTDSDRWCEWVISEGGEPDWVWREGAINRLLTDHDYFTLFVAGCKTNQGKFYDRFDAVVLLSAPVEVLKARISSRTASDYGKAAPELAEILGYLETVEPLLRAGATAEIDTRRPLSEIADELERIAGCARRTSR